MARNQEESIAQKRVKIPKQQVTQEIFQEPKQKFMEKEVKLTISPGKILKICFILLILVVVFFAGRWSIDAPVLGELSLFEDSGETSLDSPEETEELADEETSENQVEETPPDESNSNEINAAVVTNTESEEELDTDADIITNYDKIAYSLSDIRKDAKEGWGKITHLDYTIKNNDVGTIKAEYILIEVTGYDLEKKVMLPESAKTVYPGQTVKKVTAIKNGFAYSEATSGDLTKVQVQTKLYDKNDKLISSYIRKVDLS